MARSKCRHRGLTDAELAEASGLSISHIYDLSRTVSWDKIRVVTMVEFCTACGVDPFTRQIAQLRRRKRWWSISPEEQTRLALELHALKAGRK